jgi:hypothetical protein
MYHRINDTMFANKTRDLSNFVSSQYTAVTKKTPTSATDIIAFVKFGDETKVGEFVQRIARKFDTDFAAAASLRQNASSHRYP